MKPVWEKPRPKSAGKPKKLTPEQKAKAKSMASDAGRPYPNMVDNMRAAKMKDGGQAKVAKVMREFKAGKLHGGIDPKGPKKAKIVTNPKQAIAIALSQAGKKRK